MNDPSPASIRQRAIDYIGVAAADGDETVALKRALAALRVYSNDAEITVITCMLLNDWQRFEDSLALLYALRTTDPERVEPALAETYEAMHRIEDALAIRHEIYRKRPEHPLSHFQYIRSLLRAGEFQLAESELRQFERFGRPKMEWHLRRLLLNGQHRRLEALELIESGPAGNPDDPAVAGALLQQLMMLCKKDGDAFAKERARGILDDLDLSEPSALDRWLPLIRLALTLDRHDDVKVLLDLMPHGSRTRGVLEVRAWAAHKSGDVEQARTLWDEIRAKNPIPQVRPCWADELTRVDGQSMGSAAGEIRLFTVIRNELWRLPWFLEYYRSRGVDRFFFVDNDSTDGSREWLLDQAEVHVFSTNNSYALGKSGMVWVNALMGEFGVDGWNIYVDVDEALVFPGIEQSSIRHLTDYMDRNGHDLAAGQMVDMFSRNPSTLGAGEYEHDFIESYPYFDNSYYRTSMRYCPYYFTSGGARRRFGAGENQTKTPIVRGGRNIQFLSSSHMVTPGVISDVSVALLHFKLAGNFQKQANEDAIVNNRTVACRLRYQAYADFMERVPAGQIDMSNNDTHRFRSSQTLVDLGLISAPASFGF